MHPLLALTLKQNMAGHPHLLSYLYWLKKRKKKSGMAALQSAGGTEEVN